MIGLFHPLDRRNFGIRLIENRSLQNKVPMSQRVAQRMQTQVEVWISAGDRRADFLRCYAAMTANMHAALANGEFLDPGWVNALLDHFAGYYFHALDAYSTAPESAPPVWQQAFTAAGEQKLSVLQNLVLGVNAHINYDLVMALVDMLLPEWAGLSATRREQRYQDHCHVNAIIARTIDQVQDEIIETQIPWMEWLDILLGPLDEWSTAHLITHWREQVWQDAVKILMLADPGEQQAYRRKVESRALHTGDLMITRRV